MGDTASAIGADDAISASPADAHHDKVVDYVLAAVIIAFCAWVVWMTRNDIPRGFRTDPLGPAALPEILAEFIAVLALALVVTRLFGARWLKPQSVGEDESFPEPGMTFSTFRFVAMIALTLAYLLLIEPLGYIVTSFVYGAAILVVVGLRDPLRVLAPPALFVAVLYATFALGLKVPLPAGPFGG